MTEFPWTRIEPTAATGDLIAFGGTSPICRAIQGLCHGPVDHVGVVLRTRAQDELFTIWLIEAVRPQVRVFPLRRRLAEFDGEAWWLPLGLDKEKRCDFRRMVNYMLGSIGRGYDEWQAVRVGLNLPNPECDHAYFCSELAAFIYEAGHLINPKINCSNTDPVELCKWALWGTDYHYIKGDNPRELPDFNTVSVG